LCAQGWLAHKTGVCRAGKMAQVSKRYEVLECPEIHLFSIDINYV